MITRLSHVSVWVLDQERAREFYTTKLGFQVRTDATVDGFRWLTVGPPDQPDVEMVLIEPGPPMLSPEDAETVCRLIAKGVIGPGVLATDDCTRDYDVLSGRGVTFLQEPAQRPYGIEAVLRDDSGNWFSLTQRREG
jgi:catechol 2,3-dioxygenase-like lactoylglutathione lyase family enzyme